MALWANCGDGGCRISTESLDVATRGGDWALERDGSQAEGSLEGRQPTASASNTPGSWNNKRSLEGDQGEHPMLTWLAVLLGTAQPLHAVSAVCTPAVICQQWLEAGDRSSVLAGEVEKDPEIAREGAKGCLRI